MSSACSYASKLNTIAQRLATWWTPPARPCAPPPSRGQRQKIMRPMLMRWRDDCAVHAFLILRNIKMFWFYFPKSSYCNVAFSTGWHFARHCTACTRRWRRSGGAPSPTLYWQSVVWRRPAQSTEELCSGWKTSPKSWTQTPTNSWKSFAR